MKTRLLLVLTSFLCLSHVSAKASSLLVSIFCFPDSSPRNAEDTIFADRGGRGRAGKGGPGIGGGGWSADGAVVDDDAKMTTNRLIDFPSAIRKSTLLNPPHHI